MNLVQKSKFLSLVLRHKPEEISLELDQQGWTSVPDVLEGTSMTMSELKQVVAQNNKKRFEFNEDQTRIRARQGHSVEIDLDLQPLEPPIILYHGTTQKKLAKIKSRGLKRMQRHHVHLSPDEQTALAVGGRHGKPLLLVVRAGEMFKEGYTFYRTGNNVWLVDHVPWKFLRVLYSVRDGD